MANEYAVNQNDLTAVANAIRTKGGTTAGLSFPDGFVNAIAGIPSGSKTAKGTVTTTTAASSITLTMDFKPTIFALVGGGSARSGIGMFVIINGVNYYTEVNRNSTLGETTYFMSTVTNFSITYSNNQVTVTPGSTGTIMQLPIKFQQNVTYTWVAIA